MPGPTRRKAPRRIAPAAPRRAKAAKAVKAPKAKAAARRTAPVSAPTKSPAKPAGRTVNKAAPRRRGRAHPMSLAPVKVQQRKATTAPRLPKSGKVSPPSGRTPRKPAAREPAAESPAAWSKPKPKPTRTPKPAPKSVTPATPKARRDTDLPTVDGLTTLVIAKSAVTDGKLHLNVKAPKSLTLPTLHVLRVEHAYELGKSKDSLECRFVLTAKIGGQTPPPDLVRTGDGWAATKDKTGYAQQVFRIPPGKSVLEYEVHSECYTLGKRSGDLVASQRRVAKGTIPLRGS